MQFVKIGTYTGFLGHATTVVADADFNSTASSTFTGSWGVGAVKAAEPGGGRPALSDYAHSPAALPETSPVKGLRDRSAVQRAIKDIDQGLTWNDTPQGHEYWRTVGRNLRGFVDNSEAGEGLFTPDQGIERALEYLRSSFVWGATPQGEKYWHSVYENLSKLKGTGLGSALPPKAEPKAEVALATPQAPLPPPDPLPPPVPGDCASYGKEIANWSGLYVNGTPNHVRVRVWRAKVLHSFVTLAPGEGYAQADRLDGDRMTVELLGPVKDIVVDDKAKRIDAVVELMKKRGAKASMERDTLNVPGADTDKPEPVYIDLPKDEDDNV